LNTAEGSYSFREPGQIKGLGSSLVASSDSLGAQSSFSSSWIGLWSFLVPSYSTAWGRFTNLYLQNQVPFAPGTGALQFALDLSGFQLKAGLRFNF
jgi:hypothetical protein